MNSGVGNGPMFDNSSQPLNAGAFFPVNAGPPRL
jgi:hypothetical protein